jgi:hypothetical protein
MYSNADMIESMYPYEMAWQLHAPFLTTIPKFLKVRGPCQRGALWGLAWVTVRLTNAACGGLNQSLRVSVRRALGSGSRASGIPFLAWVL